VHPGVPSHTADKRIRICAATSNVVRHRLFPQNSTTWLEALKPVSFGRKLRRIMKYQSKEAAGRISAARSRIMRTAGIFLALFACANARAVQSVSLGWNAVTNGGAAGYNLYYWNAGGKTNLINAGTNSSVTVSGLTEGQTNYFVVAAYDSAGVQGPTSSQVSYIVPGLMRATLATQGGRSMKLQFPVASGHYYVVQTSTNLTSWSTLWQSANSTSNAWLTYSDPMTSSVRQKFYRLVLH
jgi:hypothetical protein